MREWAGQLDREPLDDAGLRDVDAGTMRKREELLSGALREIGVGRS